jgi:N-dimethylarginine dimethylaminohydrolase
MLDPPRLLMSPPKAGGDLGRQWDALVEAVKAGGATVDVIDRAPEGTPDLVSTGSGALIYGRLAFLTATGGKANGQRRRVLREALDEREFETRVIESPGAFVGGDVLLDRERDAAYFAKGSTITTAPAVERSLRELLNRTLIVPLNVVETSAPSIKRLSAALCPLGSGNALVYEPAFDSASLAEISKFSAGSVLKVGADSPADRFVCGGVETQENTLVVPKRDDYSPALTEGLKKIGYELHQVEISKFVEQGFSVKDLALRLNDNPARSLHRVA